MTYTDIIFDKFLKTVQRGHTPTIFYFKIFIHKYED